MSRAEVWAPKATRVELLTPDRQTEMEPVGDGWFRSPHELEPGGDYGFRLDGGGPLPDPRSQWQPRGPSAPSRVLDHAAFAWTDGRWSGVHLPSSVIYELHVGTFSAAGTFLGVIEHLDHLLELGIGVIEVMPIAAFDGVRGWGYDGVSLFAPHEPYGGPEAFKRLVDSAHARGLGVVLDVVYNHFGPTGNHLGQFGPYTFAGHQTPWGDGVNLDGPDCAPVRRFFLDNARHWFEHYHVDGLRLDAVHALVDESDHHFLADLAAETDALATHVGRPLWLIAEYPTTTPIGVISADAGGHGLDAEWRDEVHHSLHAWLTGERSGYYSDYGRVADLAEAMTGPKEPLSRSRFIVCAQNHDQVGNRARGERLAHLLDPGLAKVAAALVLLSPFVPLLFMGEEWAASSPFPYFAGPRSDDLDDAVRHGRREEFASFGWDPSTIPDPIDPATFDSARLDWSETADTDHRTMFEWYRALISLRRAHPELSDPRPLSTGVDEHDSENSLVMWRGDTAIAVNTDSAPAHVSLDGARGRRVLLASEPAALTDDGVLLAARSVAVVGR